MATEDENNMILEKKLRDELRQNEIRGKVPIQVPKVQQGLLGTEDPRLNVYTEGSLRLGYLAGLVKTSDAEHMMRAIYRASRGKIVVNLTSLDQEMMRGLEDPDNPESKENLSVFLLIMTVSAKDVVLTKKLVTIVQSCKAKILPLPPSHRGFEHTIEDLERQVSDLSHLKEKGDESLLVSLKSLAAIDTNYLCSQIEVYRLILRKYKLIFSTLNMFSDTGSLLVGSFWAAKTDNNSIIEAVDKLKVGSLWS